MAALKNADGTPIKELNELLIDNKTRLKLQEIFGVENLTPKILLNEINIKFDEIFKIAE